MNTDVKTQKAATDESKGETSGRLSLSGLIGSLLDASFSKSKSSSSSETEQEIIQESRSHTEASIAIGVYDRLDKRVDLLQRLTSLDDMDRLRPGALVELSGRVEKNAVDAMIDYMGAVKIMAGLGDAKPDPKEKAVSRQIDKMHRALVEDRKRTPISNVLVRCTEPPGLSAILTLRTSNLRDLTMSELHRNDLRVVGKVTRRIPEGETVGTFENYGLGMLDAATLKDVFGGITSTDGFDGDFSEVEISGPAIQLLPLMVFV